MGWRPVIHLSSLNSFVTLTKFQMETVAFVLGYIRKRDWMFLIDLKDVYFQIPFHPESRLYLWFCLKGCVYQFRALCFSLSTAPQMFTRVFALISEWVHWRSVRLLCYLDEWLVIVESRALILQHRDLVLQLCRDLGIVVNWEKLDPQLSTLVQYLGMLIDTFPEKVFPFEACLTHFWEVAISSLLLPLPQARMWQRLLGHMASLEWFLRRGRSCMRPLQWGLKDHWSPVVGNPAVQIPLSSVCVEAVCWWLQEDRWVFGVPLQVPPLSLLLHTDMSLSGWEAHLLDLMASGVWSQKECSLRINVLEMKPLFWQGSLSAPVIGQSVVLMSDNASVVAYLRNQGGTVSRILCCMTAEVVLWTETHSVSLTTRYILRKKNVLADQLSRPDQILLTERSLLPRVFEGICRVFSHPHLDLFATHVNAQLPLYISPVPDMLAWKQGMF